MFAMKVTERALAISIILVVHNLRVDASQVLVFIINLLGHLMIYYRLHIVVILDRVVMADRV